MYLLLLLLSAVLSGPGVGRQAQHQEPEVEMAEAFAAASEDSVPTAGALQKDKITVI